MRQQKITTVMLGQNPMDIAAKVAVQQLQALFWTTGRSNQRIAFYPSYCAKMTIRQC